MLDAAVVKDLRETPVFSEKVVCFVHVSQRHALRTRDPALRAICTARTAQPLVVHDAYHDHVLHSYHDNADMCVNQALNDANRQQDRKYTSGAYAACHDALQPLQQQCLSKLGNDAFLEQAEQ